MVTEYRPNLKVKWVETTGLFVSTTGLFESTTGLFESTTGLFESTTELFESTTELLESTTELLESTTGLFESTDSREVDLRPHVAYPWASSFLSFLAFELSPELTLGVG